MQIEDGKTPNGTFQGILAPEKVVFLTVVRLVGHTRSHFECFPAVWLLHFSPVLGGKRPPKAGDWAPGI